MKSFLKIIGILLLTLNVVGCASFGRTMKNLVSGDSPPENTQTGGGPNQEGAVAPGALYSQKNNMPIRSDKQYHRISKEEFEQENLMNDRNGSLWVMEGQESYLFSQNIVRLPGDILNVQLDGQPQKQLSTKVGVIKQLMDQAVRAARVPAMVNGEKQKEEEKEKNEEGKLAKENEKPESTAEKTADGKEKEGSPGFDVNQIPVRIVDRSMDGSYRVKGSQVFMIGKEEYKVIVSGLVRPGDISDGGVSSSKIIDSKFDVVRSRKRSI